MRDQNDANGCDAGARKDGSSGNALLTVYYDGSCPLCTAEIRHYAGLRGSDRLDFIDVSAADSDTGNDLAAGDAMKRFHVRLDDGRLLSGASAFVAIWQHLPRWGWAARLAAWPGVTPVLELAYRSFLPVRPLLSRLARRLGARPAVEKDGGM